MNHNGQTFKGTEISLDGNTYTGCTFQGCNLMIGGAQPFHLRACKVLNCTYGFRGPALRTIHTLHLLYQTGEVGIVEGLFNQIRTGPIRPPESSGSSWTNGG
jgi:hypothetical protein